jgi:hypothetical protein
MSCLSSSHNKVTCSNKIAQLSARSLVMLRGRTSGASFSGSSTGWASRMSFLSCLEIQMKLKRPETERVGTQADMFVSNMCTMKSHHMGCNL